jgi:hypothetical protein
MNPLNAKNNLLALKLESNFRRFTYDENTGTLVKLNGIGERFIRFIMNIFTLGSVDKKVREAYNESMKVFNENFKDLRFLEFTATRIHTDLLNIDINNIYENSVNPNDDPYVSSEEDEKVVDAPEEIERKLIEDEETAKAIAAVEAAEAEEAEKAAEPERMNKAINVEAAPVININWGSLKVVTSLVERIKNTDNQMEFLVQIAFLSSLGEVFNRQEVDKYRTDRVITLVRNARAEGFEIKIDQIIYDLGSLTEEEVEQKMKTWINETYDNPKPEFGKSFSAAIKAGIILKETMDSMKVLAQIKGGEALNNYVSIVKVLQMHFSRAKMILGQLLIMDNLQPSIASYRQKAAGLFDPNTEQIIQAIEDKI